MKRMLNSTLKILNLDGKVWVGVWSIAALIKFLGAAPLDNGRVYLFLGVLGLFTGHRIADVVSTNMNQSEEK